MNARCILLILLTSLDSIIAGRTYIFKLRVASFILFGDTSTTNQLYFRLCHNASCSTFTSIPNGLQSRGATYQWNVTTPTDYDTINKMQIVHTGDDALCLTWVDVDGIKYDTGAPLSGYCWESNGYFTACSTLTVTSANDWSTSITNPCEYASLFHVTYNPTPIPTESTFIPTVNPTANPTNVPTTTTMKRMVDPKTTTTDAYGDDTNDNDANRLWMWFGIIFAALFLCLLIAFIIYCHYSKKKLKKETDKSDQAHVSKVKSNGIIYEPVVDDCAPGAAYVDPVPSVRIEDHLIEGVKYEAQDIQREGHTTCEVLLDKHSDDDNALSDSEDLYDPGPEPKETPTTRTGGKNMTVDDKASDALGN